MFKLIGTDCTGSCKSKYNTKQRMKKEMKERERGWW
jgi:hypothetical protein